MTAWRDTPVVSVVMAACNGERFLHEAVASILSQTFTDFEFIIINDGSTDGTVAILDSYARRDSRVQVHHQENRGIAESLNRGDGLARGKYIARLDQDDVALGDRLRKEVEFLERRHEVGVVGGAVDYIGPTGRTLATRRYPLEDHELRLMLESASPFVNSAVLMRKHILDSVGGYRRAFKYAEDYDLWCRIAGRCQFSNLDEVVVKYRIHPDQTTCHRLREQTFAALAARALASNGWQDRLGSIEEITPEVLAALGVSRAAAERALAANYPGEIESMCRVSEEPAALRLVMEMLRSLRWEDLGNRLLSDTWLRAAGLLWGEKQFLQSLAAVAHAVMVRPLVAGRPLKILFDRLVAR